jgi:uncharacterized protein involved in exopolysaccharide biosynthesis/Mrp family chromosome partitioning ATPase
MGGTAPVSGLGSHAVTDATTLLKLLVRHKLLLGLPILVALGFGWLLTEYLPRRYEADAVLAVDARKVRIVGNEVVSGLPLENAAFALRTELDIITSRSLAERIVTGLGLASDFGALAEVRADKSGAGVSGFFRSTTAVMLDRFGFGALLPPTPSPTPTFADVVDWVIGHLKATNDNRSFTIFVTFASESPVRAAQIANAVGQEYLNEQVALKEDITRKTSSRLAEKLGEMRHDVAAADAAVAEFRRASDLIETKGSTVIAQQISELTTQLALAKAERARAEGNLQMAQTNGGASLPEVLASNTIQELRTNLAKAEVRLAENARLLYMRPELQVTIDSYRKQLDSEMARIVASLARVAEAARAKEASLAASVQRMQAEHGKALSSTVTLSQLEREADANRVIYETFLGRYKQTLEHEGLAVPDALLITKALPPGTPVSPKKLPIMLISGLFGLLVGGVSAALRERMDDRVRDIVQLDAMASVPVLGVLPRVPGLERRAHDLLRQHPGSRLGVALQWLRAALQAGQSPRRVQVILVTSAMQGEGKTSLCVCLARELAQSGDRVLVVDADPYRPRVETMFRAAPRSNRPQPQEAASDLRDLVRDVISTIQVDPVSGAHFVAATAPRSFRQRLRTGALAQFVKVARESYDTILLDAAPTLAGADAAPLGRLADMRLFIVRCGHTTWGQMMSSLATLRLCGSPVDGIIVVGAEGRDLYHRGTYQPAWSGENSLLVGHEGGGRPA